MGQINDIIKMDRLLKITPSALLSYLVIEVSHQTVFPMTEVRSVTWLQNLTIGKNNEAYWYYNYSAAFCTNYG